MGLVRMLGRRVVPVLVAYDALQLARAARRRWMDPEPMSNVPPDPSLDPGPPTEPPPRT